MDRLISEIVKIGLIVDCLGARLSQKQQCFIAVEGHAAAAENANKMLEYWD